MLCATDLQDFTMKQKPDDMLHVRVPADLRATIKRQAEEEHRTEAGQIRYLIASAIEARAQQPEHA
jgi:hypothetical protein